jgi:hypothetical protein
MIRDCFFIVIVSHDPLLSSPQGFRFRFDSSGRRQAARRLSNSMTEFSEFWADGELHVGTTVSVPFTDM